MEYYQCSPGQVNAEGGEFVKKPLFDNPIGPSQRLHNNCHRGVWSACCELCGTQHEVDPNSESLIVSEFMGYQVVESCCGSIFDLIFEESGGEFAERFLEEFAKDPLNPRFAVLRIKLEDVLSAVGKKTKVLAEQVEKGQKVLESL